jgi:transposase
MADTPTRRPRRPFDDDFKAQAVRLVLDEGKSIPATARDLDLTESNLRTWVERARADRTHGKSGLTTAEREELARLRKENRELRTEREILKKPRPSRSTRRKVRLDRRGEGRVHRHPVLPGAGGVPERFLRVGATTRVATCG